MKIILLENVAGIGKKFEVKKVSHGYARNYLLPGKKAVIANLVNMSKLEVKQSALKKRQEKEKGSFQALAKKLEGFVLEVSERVGEKGELFESITEQKIADSLNQQGFPLNKSQIQLDQPIKVLGNFPVEVKITSDIKTKIEVRVKVIEQ